MHGVKTGAIRGGTPGPEKPEATITAAHLADLPYLALHQSMSYRRNPNSHHLYCKPYFSFGGCRAEGA